jgi:hypothetical protein
MIVMGRAFVMLAMLSCPQEDQADDYAFLRRVTLDLTGRLPAPDDVRAFARSRDREKKVEDLLASPEAARYHADLWMQWLIDHDFENGDLYRFKVGELHAWLQESFAKPFAETVKALVTRQGAGANFARKHLAGEDPPVKLALLNARLFMGRDLRCAQCHDHPHDKLTHEEFWGFVACFGEGRGGIKDHLGEVSAEARFLDGRKPEGDRLEALFGFMEWRPAVAERYWKLFMGRKSHPADLEKFETPRELVRAIVSRKEYRARKGPLKLMNTVQFMNAFGHVFDLETVYKESFDRAMKNEKTLYIFKDEEVMRLFFFKWAKEMVLPKGQHPEEVEAHGTVRLSLKLMNNGKLQNYFFTGWGLLKRVLAKKTRAADRVEELFLSVLGRPPSKEERELFTAKDDASYEDIFWALVNSAEFIFVS